MNVLISDKTCCDGCDRTLLGEATGVMVMVVRPGKVFCSTCTDLALRQVQSDGKKGVGNAVHVTNEKAKNGASGEDAASR